MNSWHVARLVRRGLTLLELVVVLAILAAVAGMIVPKLDFFTRKAEQASGAGIQADLGTIIQAHKMSTGEYPVLDLLINENNEAVGVWGPIVRPAQLSSAWYASFSDGGLRYAFRHLSSATNLSDSTGTAATNPPIDLPASAASGQLFVAEINPEAPSGGAITYVNRIVNACFPDYGGAIPPTSKLIALGVGPRNSMVGNTMQSTPIDTQGSDPRTTYCRYLAWFEIRSDRRPAQLKLVTDHRGKMIQARLDLYNQSSPQGWGGDATTLEATP